MSRAVKPEFEPASAARQLAPRRLALLPWLRLMRLPNVFTAIADVAMGYLFVCGSVQSPLRMIFAVTCSACLYTAGMVLNDVFDFAVDAVERPFRPLPAGLISRRAATMLGIALLVVGIASAWLAGYLPTVAARPWLPGVLAIVLSACILGYDAALKITPLGPLGMGACRFVNILLGASMGQAVAPKIESLMSTAPLLGAAGIGIYIVGVTLFAKQEAGISRKGPLAAALAVMLLGLALFGASAAYHPGLQMDLKLFWLLLFFLAGPAIRRCGVAIVEPAPHTVQPAIKHSILSLIWFDAAAVAATCGPIYGVAIAALLIPALLLGRWVYST